MSKSNLFISNLTKSNTEIKETRAKRIATQAEMAQDELVRSLKTRVLDLEAKLDDLEDLSPNSTMSLNPTRGEFKAKEWVCEMHDVKVQLANAKLELEIAQKTYDKYFQADGNAEE